MKRLLGISIAAMLAVTPMMANAAQQSGNLDAASGSERNRIATTSYVKGAYNAVKTEHDKVVSDITVNQGQNETLYHITAGDSVAENLKSLDSAVHADDVAIGTISDLTSTTGANATRWDTGENEDIVTAINATKDQANATDALVGSSASSLTTEFGSGVDTVDKALKRLNANIGATDAKGVIVYNEWASGGAPAGGDWVGLTAEPVEEPEGS